MGITRRTLAALLFCSQPLLSSAQTSPDKLRHIPRTIWNFDGGVFMETDGDLNENTCFRLAGRVVAKDFFDHLKRIDDDRGTRFLRGKEEVNAFPEQVKLLFVIHDEPCPWHWRDASHRQFLTRELMGTMRLSIFWKHGVDLRPADNFKLSFFSINPVPPYATDLAKSLPEKLQWAYELDIPSAGIPLTDSLVLVFRRNDGRIAARVAARL
jgi:hypothetical protein